MWVVSPTLSARWRIFCRLTISEQGRAITYTKAALVLHNYLRTTESSVYALRDLLMVRMGVAAGLMVDRGEMRREFQGWNHSIRLAATGWIAFPSILPPASHKLYSTHQIEYNQFVKFVYRNVPHLHVYGLPLNLCDKHGIWYCCTFFCQNAPNFNGKSAAILATL